MKPMLCDREFEGPMTSPFAKIIVLGYYDGPISGLLQCADCPTAYRFELIAWDSNQDNRVFSLAEVDSDVFESVIHTLASVQEPKWPIWVVDWKFESTTEEKRIHDSIDRALEKASTAKLVIATPHIAKDITMCREITDEERTVLPTEGDYPQQHHWTYWQQHLGLNRSAGG